MMSARACRHLPRLLRQPQLLVPRLGVVTPQLKPSVTVRLASSSGQMTSGDKTDTEIFKTSGDNNREERLFGRMELEFRAHQPEVLKSYAWFVETTAKELDVPVLHSEGESEPHKTRKTLLKSAFVHSKHRAQYEMRTYYWTMTMEKLTESTKDTLLEYVQRNLPEGVAMRVELHEWKRLPQNIRDAIAKSKT